MGFAPARSSASSAAWWRPYAACQSGRYFACHHPNDGPCEDSTFGLAPDASRRWTSSTSPADAAASRGVYEPSRPKGPRVSPRLGSAPYRRSSCGGGGLSPPQQQRQCGESKTPKASTAAGTVALPPRAGEGVSAAAPPPPPSGRGSRRATWAGRAPAGPRGPCSCPTQGTPQPGGDPPPREAAKSEGSQIERFQRRFWPHARTDSRSFTACTLPPREAFPSGVNRAKIPRGPTTAPGTGDGRAGVNETVLWRCNSRAAAAQRAGVEQGWIAAAQ